MRMTSCREKNRPTLKHISHFAKPSEHGDEMDNHPTLEANHLDTRSGVSAYGTNTNRVSNLVPASMPLIKFEAYHMGHVGYTVVCDEKLGDRLAHMCYKLGIAWRVCSYDTSEGDSFQERQSLESACVRGFELWRCLLACLELGEHSGASN